LEQQFADCCQFSMASRQWLLRPNQLQLRFLLHPISMNYSVALLQIRKQKLQHGCITGLVCFVLVVCCLGQAAFSGRRFRQPGAVIAAWEELPNRPYLLNMILSTILLVHFGYRHTANRELMCLYIYKCERKRYTHTDLTQIKCFTNQ
jgi:hypothetical protein